MALVLANRVRETTTTTGTGTITLAGAVTGYQSFAAIGNSNTTYYTISGQGTSQWEVGIGTYTASGTTLSRDTVLASSNSGSLVSFSAGTKDVFVTYPSNKSVYLDASGNASSLGTPAAFTATNVTGLPVSTGISGLGTGVATALGVNTGSAGAFVVNGGALGTPSSGTVTNLTGTASINTNGAHNGTVGATTPNTGAFTTGSFSGVASFAAGSVSAPSIYLSTDTGTGFYRIGANNYGFAVSGSKVLDITSTGLAITGGQLTMTGTANGIIDLSNTNSSTTVIKMGTDQYGSGSGINMGMLSGGVNGVASTGNFTVKVGTSVSGAATVAAFNTSSIVLSQNTSLASGVQLTRAAGANTVMDLTNVPVSSGATPVAIFRNDATSGDNMFTYWITDAGVLRGSIDFNRAGGLVRYNTTSDGVLKNILGDAPRDKSVAILAGTRLREYSWKTDPTGKPQIGVIAQELFEVFPGAVSVGGEYEEQDADGNTVTKYRPWAVDKTAYQYHLVAGWQAHDARLAAIEAKLALLEAKNA